LKPHLLADFDQVPDLVEKEKPWKHEMWICTRPLVFNGRTDALRQPAPETLVSSGQFEPRPPLPVCLYITVLLCCIQTVLLTMAVFFSLLSHQLAVDTVAME